MRAVGTADFATLTVGVDAVRSLAERLSRARLRLALAITTYERPDALGRGARRASRASASRPTRSSSPTTARARRRASSSTASRARSAVPVRLVSQPHEGFRVARLRNLASRRRPADYLVFVDGDMLLHPEFIADHARCARRGYFTQGVRVLADARADAPG